MKIHKYFSIFIIIVASRGAAAESLDLTNLYECLATTSNKDYWSNLNRQILDISKISSKIFPEFTAELAKTSDAFNSNLQEPAYVSIRAEQVLYDKNLNQQVDSAEAALETIRWQKTSSTIEDLKNTLQTIFLYYKMLEEKQIIDQKLSRQSKLVSVLRDMVKSKISDGVLLTLSESDLTLLQIKSNELGLRIQKIQKSILAPEPITKAIVNGTVLKLAKQLAATRKFSRRANKANTEAFESQKKQIEIENRSFGDTFFPRVAFGLNYFSFLEKSGGVKPADELQVSLQLRLNFSELYTSAQYSKNQAQQLDYIQAKLKEVSLKLAAEDDYNLERINQINLSLKDLNQVKTNIENAKDVLSKKLLLNKASYSDYISVDDKLDDVDMQIASMQFEKLQLVVNNDAEALYSSSRGAQGASCSY